MKFDYTNLIIILSIVCVLALLVWALNSMFKQSTKDWETLRSLEKKANEVQTKEEIEALYTEIIEAGNKIFNKFIHARIHTMLGYLKGLHKGIK